MESVFFGNPQKNNNPPPQKTKTIQHTAWLSQKQQIGVFNYTNLYLKGTAVPQARNYLGHAKELLLFVCC